MTKRKTTKTNSIKSTIKTKNRKIVNKKSCGKIKKQVNINKTKQIKYSKIQKQIIDYVLNNKTKLSFNVNELKPSDQIFKIADEIKNTCLAIISDEFGSAVCIGEKGFILTCAHAAPAADDEKSNENQAILIFPNGEIVKAKTIEKDEDLDLALLKVIEVQVNGRFKKIEKIQNKFFPFTKIKSRSLNENLLSKNAEKNENVFCIGNPAFAEFRNAYSSSYYKNEYMPFWFSKGKIKGYMKDEVYGDDDLGPMIHSCWTYWGHSGAPIFNYNCELVGLHNSWNDKNANRHGVSLLGINKFLSRFKNL